MPCRGSSALIMEVIGMRKIIKDMRDNANVAIVSALIPAIASILVAVIEIVPELNDRQETIDKLKSVLEEVEVFRNGKSAGKSLTGDAGRYYIARLEAGRYAIEVRKGRKRLYSGSIELPKDRYHNIAIH